MIIRLKGANFSSNNVGTLDSWSVQYVLGSGTTRNGVTSVDMDNPTFSATVTLSDGYEVGSAGITVIMGGTAVSNAYSISGNVITFSITTVTGNIVIKVPTVNTATGEEDGGSSSIPGTNISGLFTFNLTNTAYMSTGLTKSSTFFDSCSPVDISSYGGTHLRISHANFTPTAGGLSGYGAVFFDASGNLLKQEAFPSYTSSGPKGVYVTSYLEIPVGAKTFATSIFNSAAISNGVYTGTTSDFSCSVLVLSKETDITSMFDFNTGGYAWRVEAGDGNIISYQTQYWNSDTVDMSAYAGKFIRIAAPVARTTDNKQSPYGYAYEDVSGNKYVLHRFALLDDGGTLLAGDVTDLIMMLPSDIKNLLVCYFSDAMYNAANPITEDVRNGFYCKLIE